MNEEIKKETKTVKAVKNKKLPDPHKLTPVEMTALKASGMKIQYDPSEKSAVIVVDSFPTMGYLTALRFIEWVQNNPGGVISLPTGKTPEYFIKDVIRLMQGWDNNKEIQEEMKSWGIDISRKPQMDTLHFVQIDEFYPISPTQTNSFYNYVQKYYIQDMGLDPKKGLFINCDDIALPEGSKLTDIWPDGQVNLSLRYRQARTKLEIKQQNVLMGIDSWCNDYEDRIQALGGIGFFLGGIGPDGHIGFNVRGSDLHSTTRLTEVNYETQAAASSDLGGIEIAKKRLVVTIGLGTITYRKDAVAIIIAAGEAKSHVVAKAITREKDIRYPATVLQKLPSARFIITTGAAKNLSARNLALFELKESVTEKEIEDIVINLSLKTGKAIKNLTIEDYRSDNMASALLKKNPDSPETLNERVTQNLKLKIEKGSNTWKDTTFLHTEPHHDDIMLGYMPFAVRHVREHSNNHFFTTITSGFTAVSNLYMLNLSQRLKEALEQDKYSFSYHLKRGYFNPANERYRNRDVWKYLDGLASQTPETMEEGTLRRFLRNLIEIFEDSDLKNLHDRNDELINYFQTQYPGKKDLPYIQLLKGMCREWESACLWGYFGWDSSHISNLRLGFYKGEIFTEEPTVQRDVLPVYELLKKVKPTAVSVALDPEASGPDTHYKVMQAVSEALQRYREETGAEIKVIGYRNVWYKFQPSDASVIVPVSLNMFTLQYNSFMNTYISQKEASFPSYEYDGPFPLLAQNIQVNQYEQMKTCLGRDWFYDHPSPLIRATRGFVYLKVMDIDEFAQLSRELKKRAENL